MGNAFVAHHSNVKTSENSINVTKTLIRNEPKTWSQLTFQQGGPYTLHTVTTFSASKYNYPILYLTYSLQGTFAEDTTYARSLTLYMADKNYSVNELMERGIVMYAFTGYSAGQSFNIDIPYATLVASNIGRTRYSSGISFLTPSGGDLTDQLSALGIVFGAVTATIGIRNLKSTLRIYGIQFGD